MPVATSKHLLVKTTSILLLVWMYIFAPLFTLASLNPQVQARTDESEDKKIAICHATSSTRNPWNAIEIKNSELTGHLLHGDFRYFGPLNKEGKPARGADQWCEDNAPVVPTVTPTTTPTPTATPTPTPTDDGYDWELFTVRICHYVAENTYTNEFITLAGHFYNHRKHENDIIPNLTYKVHGVHIYYPGKNWPAGEAIWRNNCLVPEPTTTPTVTPTEEPTTTPTETPTVTPTEEPTTTPTETPSVTPTEEPTTTPSETPTATPTEEPTSTPTETPSTTPTEEPTTTPSETPTTTPTDTLPPTTTPTTTDGTGEGEEVEDNTDDEDTTIPPVTTGTVQGTKAEVIPTPTPTGTILGERTCNNTVKLVGITYVDVNKNGTYDFGEKLLSNITGKVTYNVESKEYFVDHFISDNTGRWEMELCPGEYNITINNGSLPRGITDTADVHKINVLADQAETTAMLTLLATASWQWSWWWLLLVVFILAVIYYIYRKRREYVEGTRA